MWIALWEVINNFVSMNLNKLKQLHSIPDEDEVDDIIEAAEELDLPVVELASKTRPVVKEVSGDRALMEVVLEPGDEIIEGKLYKAHMFKPGNKAHTGRQEGPRDSTIARKMWNIKDRRMMKHFMSTVGVEKAMDILMDMDGKDYFAGFVALVPYFMPKIASVEFKSDDTHSIDEYQKKSKQSVVIIRNMSTGTERRINTD